MDALQARYQLPTTDNFHDTLRVVGVHSYATAPPHGAAADPALRSQLRSQLARVEAMAAEAEDDAEEEEAEEEFGARFFDAFLRMFVAASGSTGAQEQEREAQSDHGDH